MGEKYLLSYEQLPQSSNGLNSIETLNSSLLRVTAEICPSCDSQLGQEFRKLLMR